MNIAAPEIVLGASLLGFFITIQGQPAHRGVPDLLIAHVMFSIAYVAITVRARLAGFDRSLEEAAQDLGPPVGHVPEGHPAAHLARRAGRGPVAFALSIDDFVISNFVAGTQETFPLWVYGAVTRRHPAAGVRPGHADLHGCHGLRANQPGHPPQEGLVLL